MGMSQNLFKISAGRARAVDLSCLQHPSKPRHGPTAMAAFCTLQTIPNRVLPIRSEILNRPSLLGRTIGKRRCADQ